MGGERGGGTHNRGTMLGGGLEREAGHGYTQSNIQLWTYFFLIIRRSVISNAGHIGQCQNFIGPHCKMYFTKF